MASWKLHKYYRGLVVPMIRDAMTPLLPKSKKLTNGHIHAALKSITKTETTSKFSNKDFIEYLEEVWCIGAHLGVYIPDPNEHLTMEKIKEISRHIDDLFTLVQKYITMPIQLAHSSEVRLTITAKHATLQAFMFTENHLEITHYGRLNNSLITLRPDFKNCHLENISIWIEGLKSSDAIKELMSNESKIKALDMKISDLQAEKDFLKQATDGELLQIVKEE